MLSPNTILQNRYRVVRELGHGGMGTVYEAVDQRVNSIVALKETTGARDGEAHRAFEREAALLANLRHQALPKVMDFFSELDGDFLVMEFIPGYDLAELLDLRAEPFPQSQVLRWANDLLRVLEYLHGQNPPVIHRDIKPANLKLTKQGEIFLLDFGLAKGSVGQMPTLATSRSVRGYTPVYASLEQIHGHGTDPRSDLYSLGATLYHLLTGVVPTDAPTRFLATEEDESDPLRPIQRINPLASGNVSEVIHRAMALSRKQRPISAADMRKALRNAAEEDERHSAEEEYRRAEVRREERDEQRRRAEQQAGRRAEEEKKLQETRTRRKEKEKELVPERRPRVDAAKQNRVEEDGHAKERTARVKEEPKRELHDLPPTRPAPPGPTVAAVERPISPPISKPAVQTIPAPAPDKLKTAGPAFESEPFTQAKTTRSKGVFMIAAAILLVAIGSGIIFWSLQSTDKTSVNSSKASPASQPAESTVPQGMVYVPGGSFTMGRDEGDDAQRPAHVVIVKPFFVDINEVTNEEYEKFIKATNHSVPGTWSTGSYRQSDARKPVTGVTWDDAKAFAAWEGKRLPTEEEWEHAARGSDGRIYPWGDQWRTGLANASGSRGTLAEVGAYQGASPFGVRDMVGNAWEWTASDFRAYPGGRLPSDQPAGELKVIRGGSYESTRDYATTTYRTGWPARNAKTYEQTGFRCAKDVP